MIISDFDVRRLEASADALTTLAGHCEPVADVHAAVEVIARAARDLATCRHVQAAVTATAAGCDVEGILRAAGVLGADGKPTPRWEVAP
jgi:hypothetical protein